MKTALLASAVLGAASVALYFGTATSTANASGPGFAVDRSAGERSAAHKGLPQTAISLPMFFEPNQGQTAPQVKFLARGAGYGLFLTADEAVLELHHSAPGAQPPALGRQPSDFRSQLAARSSQASTSTSVIRMRLAGASPSARVSGASPLPGKSNYFIGNDPSKWRHDIPQFGGVQYQAVYPGIDLVYYGNQGQLEYDFRVAPAADPNQIALSFQGASAHIDSGDLVLTADDGEIRFHAPHIYQPVASGDARQNSGNAEKEVEGSFRQLAGNKIGFTVGDYDHSRELVIDPTLSYSTYIGGSGVESLVSIAVDNAGLIYVAGSTNSSDFPLPASPPADPPIQGSLGAQGATNIFIAVLNPTLQPPTYTPAQQLLYATYLGGSGIDNLSGIAVDANDDIYVAGSTSSPNFPTTQANAFQIQPVVAGVHGFLSKITTTQNKTPPPTAFYALAYSTYLSGNGIDTVAGLAIDTSNANAYVTGVTTSSNSATAALPFPASPNGYQTQSNTTAGNLQFFATVINTSVSSPGPVSMLYSTYFGGGNPVSATAVGGGIAVDSNDNMYITGTTNMLQVGANGSAPFPLLNAQQSCLNEASNNGVCTSNSPSQFTDAFVAKFNPTPLGVASGASTLVYSTYLGGENNDTGNAIAVDSSSNAYVTGSTYSQEWVCTNSCPGGFQYYGYGGDGDAYIVKIGSQTASRNVFPLTYFTYLGGSGYDVGNAIQVDSTQTVHVVGTTYSPTGSFPTTTDTLQSTYGGGGDAFVASIPTTVGSTLVNNSIQYPPGSYSTYLGGSQLDQGTGVALDIYNATYVAGNTISPNFPLSTLTPYQGQLNAGSQDAFVSEIGANSQLSVTYPSTSPSPSPVMAGTQAAFTFDIVNNGPDNASSVNFYATVPGTGLVSAATAKINSGTGTCQPAQGQGQTVTIPCYIPTLAVCSTSPCTTPATVEVDLTPSAIAQPELTQVTVSAWATANNSGAKYTSPQQTVNVADFTITAASFTPSSVQAGNPATLSVTYCPSNPSLGYNGTISTSQTTSPSIVTATTPTFPTTTLSGAYCGTTYAVFQTVPRPVTTGSLFRRGSFYATWLPIAGLSLASLGIGAGRKRRRWLLGVVLGLIAGVILLQPACGGSSSSTTTPNTGTQAGPYTITVTGSAGTNAAHEKPAYLTVT